MLEKKGYAVSESKEDFVLRKFGNIQSTIPIQKVEGKIKLHSLDKHRIDILKQIFKKYQQVYDSTIHPVYKNTTNKSIKKFDGYRSDLGDFLKQKFGLELIFHGKEGKSPYGYTIIDHAGSNVFNGKI